VGSFIFYTHNKVFLGGSNQGECGGRGMWHVWERGETYTGFLVGKPKGKRTLERQRRRWEDGIKMDLREVG
jgi:hypothetical protein